VQGEHREIGYMTEDIFRAAIDWVLRFARAGTQLELNLFGVGESLLNPNVVDFVAYARQKLPFKQLIHISTNGNNLTKEMLLSLHKAGISSIDITDHKAAATAQALRLFRECGPQVSRLLRNISRDFVYTPNNWAGQVDWFAPDEHYPRTLCPWLQRGQVMVMSDGNVTNCCIDAFAGGVFTNVLTDNLNKKEIRAIPLCIKCHHKAPLVNRNLPEITFYESDLK
jgi:hypothetical protein